MVILLLCGDRRPPPLSALHPVKGGPQKCSVLPTLLFFCLLHRKGAMDRLRCAGSVNDLLIGAMVGWWDPLLLLLSGMGMNSGDTSLMVPK